MSSTQTETPPEQSQPSTMAVWMSRLIFFLMFITKDDISQDFNHRFLIKAACISFPVVVAVATDVPFISHETRRRRKFLMLFIRAFYLGCFVNFLFITELIIHFGLPRILTFGCQVGKLVPATCEGSMEIEGPNGWPCWLARLREWTVLYLRAQGGYDAKEFRRMWLGIWAMVVVEFCVVVVLPVVLMYVDSRGQAKEAVKVDAEKGDSKSIQSVMSLLNTR